MQKIKVNKYRPFIPTVLGIHSIKSSYKVKDISFFLLRMNEWWHSIEHIRSIDLFGTWCQVIINEYFLQSNFYFIPWPMSYWALNDKETKVIIRPRGLKRDTIKNCLYHRNHYDCEKKKKKQSWIRFFYYYYYLA